MEAQNNIELKIMQKSLHWIVILVTIVSLPFSKSTSLSVSGLNNVTDHQSYSAQQIFCVLSPRQWNSKFPDGYMVTPGIGAHKLHLRQLSWNRARKACMQEGGNLAIINSSAEEQIMMQILRENNLMDAWIGTHDLFEEDDWVTVHGEPLESMGYTRWSARTRYTPNNSGGNQNCGSLAEEGGMNDLNCAMLNAFFCKLPA